MNTGKAIAIFRQIKSDKYTIEEKGWAIHRVLALETDNSIRKADYRQALHWLWNQHFEILGGEGGEDHEQDTEY